MPVRQGDKMPNYNLTRIKVLVVEKHASMRRIIRDVLRELGVKNVSLASSPEAAYEIFREEPADLVLTDWAPGLDGLKFLELVRRSDDSPNAYAPVVMVTAYTELHHVCMARDAGMNEFLAKPFNAKLIYFRIKAIIENPRLYVRNPNYFGPDRRRRRAQFDGIDRRDHINAKNSERRERQNPYQGPEKRSGFPGHRGEDFRGGNRGPVLH